MTTMCVGIACRCFKPDPNRPGWQKGPLPATWGMVCDRCQRYLFGQLTQCHRSAIRSFEIVPAVWGLAVGMGPDVFKSRSSEVLAVAYATRTLRVLDDYTRQLAGEQDIPLPGCAHKKIDLAVEPIGGVLHVVCQYATRLLDYVYDLYESVWVGDLMADLDFWGHAWHLQLDTMDAENRALAQQRFIAQKDM